MKTFYFLFFLSFPLLSITGQNTQPDKIDLSVYAPHHKTHSGKTPYAYAFAYTALTINYCIKNNITKPEEVEANAFSPMFIASRHVSNSFQRGRCGQNEYYQDDLIIFQKYGCPKLKDFTEECATKFTEAVSAKAKETALKEYFILPQSISAIKEALAAKNPVLVEINTILDFQKLGRDCNEKLPVLKHDSKYKLTDAVCIIGYDDDINSKYFGRFLVSNNLKDWGDDKNMAWVKYEDMMYLIGLAWYFTIQ